jgi:hypothetical protein
MVSARHLRYAELIDRREAQLNMVGKQSPRITRCRGLLYNGTKTPSKLLLIVIITKDGLSFYTP